MKYRTAAKTGRAGVPLEPKARSGPFGRYVGVVEKLSVAYVRSLEQRLAALRRRR